VRPALGIEVDERLNDLVTRRLGIEGVAVLRVVPGSAADAAGLRGGRAGADGSFTPGDIIVAVEGTAVDSVARLFSRLDDYGVGDTVRLTVVRDGQKTELRATLQAGSQ
jgi:S1-C subfamily serine protease